MTTGLSALTGERNHMVTLYTIMILPDGSPCASSVTPTESSQIKRDLRQSRTLHDTFTFP
jgi:hypothetical protein